TEVLVFSQQLTFLLFKASYFGQMRAYVIAETRHLGLCFLQFQRRKFIVLQCLLQGGYFFLQLSLAELQFGRQFQIKTIDLLQLHLQLSEFLAKECVLFPDCDQTALCVFTDEKQTSVSCEQKSNDA